MIGRPRRHAGQVRISGHDEESARRCGQVKDPVVLPVRAVTDGLRRVGDPAARRLSHLDQHPQVLIGLLIRGLKHRGEHAAGIDQDVGASGVAVSVAAMDISAIGVPER